MTKEAIEKMRKEIAMYTDIPQHVDNILEIVEQAGYTLSSTAKEEKLAQSFEPNGVRTPSSDLFRELADPEFRYHFIKADRKTQGDLYHLHKPSTANRGTLADKLRAASRLKLEADSRLRKISWFQDKWLSLSKKDRYFILDQIFSLISPPMDEDGLVEDGFGSAAPAVCPDCGCRAVYVCRPGDMRCGVCYDGNPKEWYTGSK